MDSLEINAILVLLMLVEILIILASAKMVMDGVAMGLNAYAVTPLVPAAQEQQSISV